MGQCGGGWPLGVETEQQTAASRGDYSAGGDGEKKMADLPGFRGSGDEARRPGWLRDPACHRAGVVAREVRRRGASNDWRGQAAAAATTTLGGGYILSSSRLHSTQDTSGGYQAQWSGTQRVLAISSCPSLVDRSLDMGSLPSDTCRKENETGY